MAPDWINRLENWKFADALAALPERHGIRGHGDYVALQGLAATFDNSGWFDGHMGAIVEVVVEHLATVWRVTP